MRHLIKCALREAMVNDGGEEDGHALWGTPDGVVMNQMRMPVEMEMEVDGGVSRGSMFTLHPSDGEPFDDLTRYRHIVGSLVYLGVMTFHTLLHIRSQFVSALTQIHYSHLLRVLRYLCGTISSFILFTSSSLQLQTYCDATWTSDLSYRRSLSIYCIFLGGSLIVWKTKK
jgi:hypothetical protein